MTPLNSEEVALSQPRISEFLSDNANKDSIQPTAPSSPDVEKTSNLRPSSWERSFAEGVPLRSWGDSKSGIVSCETEYQFNFPCGASESKQFLGLLLARLSWSMEKTTKKKEREKKQVMKGLAGMSLADLDQESSDHSSGQAKRARESSDSLSSTTKPPTETWTTWSRSWYARRQSQENDGWHKHPN